MFKIAFVIATLAVFSSLQCHCEEVKSDVKNATAPQVERKEEPKIDTSFSFKAATKSKAVKNESSNVNMDLDSIWIKSKGKNKNTGQETDEHDADTHKRKKLNKKQGHSKKKVKPRKSNTSSNSQEMEENDNRKNGKRKDNESIEHQKDEIEAVPRKNSDKKRRKSVKDSSKKEDSDDDNKVKKKKRKPKSESSEYGSREVGEKKRKSHSKNRNGRKSGKKVAKKPIKKRTKETVNNDEDAKTLKDEAAEDVGEVLDFLDFNLNRDDSGEKKENKNKGPSYMITEILTTSSEEVYKMRSKNSEDDSGEKPRKRKYKRNREIYSESDEDYSRVTRKSGKRRRRKDSRKRSDFHFKPRATERHNTTRYQPK